MTAKNPTVVASGTADELRKFTYRARAATGELITGSASAPNREAAIAELMANGMIPLEVKRSRFGLTLQDEVRFRKTPKRRSLTIVFRQLASTIRAGLPYTTAVSIAADDCKDYVLRDALRGTYAGLVDGSGLADSMAAYPDAFPQVAIQLIRAGERSGTLAETMEQVADQVARDEEMATRVRRAMVMPSLLLLGLGGVIVLISRTMLPQMAAMFDEIAQGQGVGFELPFLTRVVFTGASVAGVAIPVLIAAVLLARIWLRSQRDNLAVRERVDRAKMRIPVIGKLLHHIAIARFTRSLSVLLGAGMDQVEALRIAGDTADHQLVRAAVERVRDRRRRGGRLAVAMRDEPLFPSALVSLAESGEQSGAMSKMLGNAAQMFEDDTKRTSDSLADALAPTMLIVLGSLIAMVFLAMYLPYGALIAVV